MTEQASTLSNATITVRLIRSFPREVVKPLVFHSVDLVKTTGKDVKRWVQERVDRDAALMAYRERVSRFDSLKVHQPSRFAHKGSNWVVDTEHDDWWVGDDDPLANFFLEDEAELSLFSRSAYDAYVAQR